MEKQASTQLLWSARVIHPDGLLDASRSETVDIPYKPYHPASFPERELLNQRFHPNPLDVIIQGGTHVSAATILAFYGWKPIIDNLGDLRVAITIGFICLLAPLFYYLFATSIDPETKWGLGWRSFCTIFGIFLGGVNAA